MTGARKPTKRRPVAFPYLGGKHYHARALVELLESTGRDRLVDVFGGSGTVTIAWALAGHRHRVYNDISGDLVNVFRVLASGNLRPALLRAVRWTPPSRDQFAADVKIRRAGSNSFAAILDPVERARATIYHLSLNHSGNVLNNSPARFLDDTRKSSAVRPRQLRDLVAIGRIFRTTVVENIDFRAMLDLYGRSGDVVFFCDPPYMNTTGYAAEFSADDHARLASTLASLSAPSVVTAYECPDLDRLYSSDRWRRVSLGGGRMKGGGGTKPAEHVALIRRD